MLTFLPWSLPPTVSSLAARPRPACTVRTPGKFALELVWRLGDTRFVVMMLFRCSAHRNDRSCLANGAYMRMDLMETDGFKHIQ